MRAPEVKRPEMRAPEMQRFQQLMRRKMMEVRVVRGRGPSDALRVAGSAPESAVRRRQAGLRSLALAGIGTLGAAPSALAQSPLDGGGGGPTALLFQLVPFLIVFGIFYVILVRPQSKRRQEHAAMIAGLKKGDEVLTQGGFFGVVVGTKDDVVVLKIAEDTKIEVLKQAITGMRGKPVNG
jgi:preprotein translocase subunit YajC